MAPVASLEQPQHMRALARANEARRRSVRVKRDLKAGRVTVGQALADPDSESLKVCDLLMAQPRWGRAKAVKLLGPLFISETRRVRDLTLRQRRLLADVCASRGGGER